MPELCDTCLTRAETNPLRAFDCKNPDCAQVMEGAPKITDCLCDDCRAHYQTVKEPAGRRRHGLRGRPHAGARPGLLHAHGVRGRRWWTAWEARTPSAAADATTSWPKRWGAGRRRASGFALGFERCVLAPCRRPAWNFPRPRACEVFVACVPTDSVRAQAFSLVQACRDAGLSADVDHQQRSLKSQFKLADKLGAHYVAVLGPDELVAGSR